MIVSTKGIKLAVNKLGRTKHGIKSGTKRSIGDVARIGLTYAKLRSPYYSGDTSNAIMLNFPSKNEALIISRPGRNDNGYPVNVLFDEGTLDGFNWYPISNPRNPNSIGFMKKTKMFLEREFSKRLKLEVSRATA